MIKNCHLIFCLLICATLLSYWPRDAEAVDGYDGELSLFQFINQARRNPIGFANSMGITEFDILKEFPELSKSFTEGMEPLRINGLLYKSANAHTDDMLRNNYYSKTSIDGKRYFERIQGAGYTPALSGEAIGLLAFQNFIEMNKAVEIIFRRMLMAEFDLDRPENLTVLNPDLEEVGIAIGHGNMNLSGEISNVYVVTCDFGVSYVEEIEYDLLAILNQMRNSPDLYAKSIGITDSYGIKSAPPLTFNSYLYQAAENHSMDMLERGYLAHVSPEGSDVERRIRETGYLPSKVGEVIRLIASTEYIDPETAAKLNLERIFGREIKETTSATDDVLLNYEFEEVGVSFINRKPVEHQQTEATSIYDEYYVYVVVCTFGTPELNNEFFVVGNIYNDLNGDALYGFDEGLSGVPVWIQSIMLQSRTFTGPGGSFRFSVPFHLLPKSYTVASPVMEAEKYLEIGKAGETTNIFVDFRIEPNSGMYKNENAN